MLQIDKTAIIEGGALIADGVTVGPYAFIGKEVTIGGGTIVSHGAHIEGRTAIGENNRIFPYAVLGTAPQDLKYAGEPTHLEIGSGNTIREFCQINVGTAHGGGVTRVGDDCLIMGHVHIAHDNQIGNGCIIANFVALAGHVEIGDYAVIGGESAVHQFVHIGRCAMIAGASAVSQDIPPFLLADGNRVRIRSLNLIGLRRRFSHGEIDLLNRTFKRIFRANRAPKAAAESLLSGDLDALSREFCEFIAAAKRGVPNAHYEKEEHQ
ncbi:MAG: acyl-ACP--UDP-N-acetylglucosamine O-acyltransferase [Helicobacteraceae bacterium]|jgi:UDP-N-acetylglucosamine acyltransferase|nr:acyl-ACP--UDP-N-acetylglucosamine O-acyltransferase [Helicobacteraceae bacterium]